MIILITGASHTGKTALAQKLLEKYKISYLSIDHLKMGLIRSGYTKLTPKEDNALTDYLWPIICEMIKTSIENGQNLIIEGCYIPFDWAKDFSEEALRQIRYRCLIMSEAYILHHYHDIVAYANVAEARQDDSACTQAALILENAENLRLCRQYGADYILIDGQYHVDAGLFYIPCPSPPRA